MPSRPSPEPMANLPDDGCDVAPSCFECPLPDCKHADPAPYQRWRHSQRDRPIMDAIQQRGLSPAAAERFGVSTRQIYRVIRRNRPTDLSEQERS